MLLNTAHTMSRLVKEGYLYKRATNTFKTWTRRFFLLQGGQLLYIQRDKVGTTIQDMSPGTDCGL
jgi:hypothetical protein